MKEISMYPRYSRPIATTLPLPLPQARRDRSFGPLAMLVKALHLISVWRRRARERADLRLLCELDPRTLKDIGLGPDDVQREISRPFWK